MSSGLVVITGASSGIGETFARRLAPEHDLLLIARREDRMQALARELQSAYGNQVNYLVADLADENDVDRIAEHLESDRRLVLLVNNAGFGTDGLFWQAPFDGQERMHKVHVLATLRLTHSALRNLVSQNRGGIINVASVSAFVRVPGTTSYAATKSWMTTFTEGIHLELQSAGSAVVVQALCPGFTYSEFHEAMGVTREQLSGGKGFWMTSEYVVDASLDGLRRRKLFVIPNWRYRLLTAFLSKLPSAVRLSVEARVGQMRSRSRTAIGNGQGQKGLPGQNYIR